MTATLHVCPVMFGKMQEASSKADFYQTDPMILAMGQTGIDWRLIKEETHVVCDLDTPEDRPDGIARLDP
jgi:hypothetical protein